MRSLLGQQVMIGISGLALTADEKKFIVDRQIGGITLFGRNVQEPKQIWELCKEIQSLRHQTKDKIPLFIAIDMEGGRVARLKAPFTQWPPVRKLGDIDSPTLSFHFAHAMGQELRAVGINVDWAPCVDIFTNPENKVIGDRALGDNAETVERHASAMIRGYLKSGIIPCAKHFPGHGHTLLDSHEELPVADHTLERLQEVELLPFKRAVKSRVEFIMAAHILFKNIDKDVPVTFSEVFLKKIVRGEMRYKGLVVTDDLGMKAMVKHYDLKEIPVRALQAGVDILLYCNEPATPPVALDAVEKALTDGVLKEADSQASIQRVLNLKKDKLAQPDPAEFSKVAQVIGHADHFNLAQAIAKGEVPDGLVSAV